MLEELEMGGTVINEVADKSDFVKASETVWEKFKRRCRRRYDRPVCFFAID